jgi:hypothetical protein
VKPAARKLLKEGIALFNEGRYEDAAGRFEKSLAAGGGQEARFCMEHARSGPPVGIPGLARRKLHLAPRAISIPLRRVRGAARQDVNIGYA